MNESQPFSIGVWPQGKPIPEHVNADYLQTVEFASKDGNLFTRELPDGRFFGYDLSTGNIGIVIDGLLNITANGIVHRHWLETYWYSITGVRLVEHEP